MSRRIAWAQSALADLLAHIDYIAAENSEAAERVLLAIRGAAEGPAGDPHSARQAGSRLAGIDPMFTWTLLERLFFGAAEDKLFLSL